jgi:hypothetical protein
MRSVIIYLVDTTRDAVREQLSEFAGPNVGDEWRYPSGSSKPVLYIKFYDDYELEFEPGDLQSLQAAFGKMPDISVIANISGRVPADREVRLCAERLLGAFRGVAQDGYSDYFWTLAEIRSGARIQGHAFFDYEGWFRNTRTG